MSEPDTGTTNGAISKSDHEIGPHPEFPRKPIDSVTRPFSRLLHTETTGGIALFASSLVALIMANCALAETYAELWETNFRIGLGRFELSYPLGHWINDGLMAVFFTAKLNALWLGVAVSGLLMTWLLNRVGVRTVGVYVCVGAAIWLATLKGGVHPTVTGAALGLLTPASAWLGEKSVVQVFEDVGRAISKRVLSPGSEHSRKLMSQVTIAARESFSPLERLEVALHPWVAFVIMPVFALTNAAVPISLDGFGHPISEAVALGLVAGKPLGIILVSAIVVRLGLGNLPEGVSWLMLAGAGSLAGIGFTMALFTAGLAFQGNELVSAKSGVLLGSVVSGILGVLLLRMATRPLPASPALASKPRD